MLDVNIAATILGIIVNLMGLGYIAVRVEHRLTKMETLIEFIMDFKRGCPATNGNSNSNQNQER